MGKAGNSARNTSASKGKAGFEAFFSSLYGDRWVPLKQSLLKPVKHESLEEGFARPYFLDGASVTAARALGALPGERVLDLCAAPGGKSLTLWLQMRGVGGELICNEFSGARRGRLKKVMQEHPLMGQGPSLHFTGRDARKWCLFEQSAYDRILLDAPCSSERHVLQSPKHLSQWSVSRIKRLAMQQYTMLVSALDVVKPGGTIVYCTCALATAENDGVIDRLLRKRPGRVEVLLPSLEQGERTSHGTFILPDVSEGRGPIYFSRIRRLA